MGKRIVFLSNAPRRVAAVVTTLELLGIGSSLYDAVVTSGEVAFHSLLTAPKTYIYLGPEKDRDVLAGSGCVEVSSYSEADFILCAGYRDEYEAESAHTELLKELKAQSLPMICINPDLLVVKQDGREILCAGLLARQYQALGGDVTYFGKPYKSVYDFAVNSLTETRKEKILAIGDSLHTDILGANSYGVDSLLITGGILSVVHGYEKTALPTQSLIDSLISEEKAVPNFVAATFS